MVACARDEREGVALGNAYITTGHYQGSQERQVWSSSLLKTLGMCPALYYRLYVLGQVVEEKEGSATDTGSAVHALNESELTGEPVPDYIKVTPKRKRMSEALLKTLEPRPKNYQVEHKFKLQVRGVIFSGTIDLLVADKGEIHDWKTTSGNPWHCAFCDDGVLDTEGVGPFGENKPCPLCGKVSPHLWLDDEALAKDTQANMYAFWLLRERKELSEVHAYWHYVDSKGKDEETHVSHAVFTRASVTPVIEQLIELAHEGEYLKDIPLEEARFVERNYKACWKYGKCKVKDSCVACRPVLERWS